MRKPPGGDPGGITLPALELLLGNRSLRGHPLPLWSLWERVRLQALGYPLGSARFSTPGVLGHYALSGRAKQSLHLVRFAKWTFPSFSVPRMPRWQEVPRTQGSKDEQAPGYLVVEPPEARLCLSWDPGF